MNSENRSVHTAVENKKEQDKGNNQVTATGDEGNTDSIKQAQLKEHQPARSSDLSSIHNTHEVGTAGGDQRANDTDPEQGAKQGRPVITNLDDNQVEPAPVEEPNNKPDIKYDEAREKETPLHNEEETVKE
ncbi:MAG: hypothetical protein ABIN67_17465 [Ferruginibacter sp.]